MSFYIGLFVWFLIAAVLIAGVVKAATTGSLILLAVGALVFVAGFIKYGCLTH